MADAASPTAPCHSAVSAMVAFLTLAGTHARQVLTAVVILLTTIACLAPNSAAQEPQERPSTQTAAQASPAVTVPAGSHFALVLTNPVSSRTTHRGDDIHAQTTAPIAVGDQVVIPAGTFVQGTVDKLRRDGNRAEMTMQSAALIFPDGYVAHIEGPLTIETSEGTAWLNPSTGTKVGTIAAPLAGLGIGAAIGSAAHTTQSSTLGGTTMTSSTPKGLAIGSMVGLAAGGVVSIVLLTRSRQFYVEVGSPMEMTLPQPLTLARDRVANAIQEAQEHPMATPMPAPRPLPQPVASAPVDHGICFTPGTPGTPPTVIPGTPGPNGIPGPPTIIPGTPPTPGTQYPCP